MAGRVLIGNGITCDGGGRYSRIGGEAVNRTYKRSLLTVSLNEVNGHHIRFKGGLSSQIATRSTTETASDSTATHLTRTVRLMWTHIDKLFDSHWLSFDAAGQLLCEHEAAREALRCWGIEAANLIRPFSREQEAFLEAHRQALRR